MAYYATSPSALEGDPTPENRVWGFFAEPNKSRLPNRQQSPQPRRKNRATTTRTVSGIPLWPSRDPIAENGGINLYHFIFNEPTNGIDYLGLCEKTTLAEIKAAYSINTPSGIFVDGGVKGTLSKDNPETCPQPCCYYADLEGDFGVGVGLSFRRAAQVSGFGIGIGASVLGEFSLAKQTSSGKVTVKFCPSTGEVSGTGRATVIDFDLGMNVELSGSVYGSLGSKFRVTGSVSGTASLAGNVSAWFDVKQQGKSVQIDFKARAYFDMSASFSFKAKVTWRGAVLYQDKFTPDPWSVFGDDRPDTGEQTLGSWTLP